MSDTYIPIKILYLVSPSRDKATQMSFLRGPLNHLLDSPIDPDRTLPHRQGPCDLSKPVTDQQR